jgi:nucleotide-binding universal stress UspA family protein
MAPPEWLEEYQADQQRALEEAAAWAAGPEAVCHSVVGAPAEAILRVATEAGADLVVVGAGRRGRLAHAFLGTIAQRVLRAASAPVLVVRAPLCRPLGRLLLTTQLDPPSAAVHEEGVETVAALFGAPEAARSLHVVWYPVLVEPLPREEIERLAREEVESFLRARRPRGFPVEPAVRVGDAAEEIAREAGIWDADLVVVGTHARGWMERAALGSVAEAAMRECTGNVLAIPPRALEGADAEARDPAAAASA